MTKNEGLTFMIEHSKSDEKTENEISSALLEAKSIRDKVHDEGNYELSDKFEKEYEQLRLSIRKALQDDQEFSKVERFKIMLELGDILEIANDNDLDDSLSYFNRIRSQYLGADVDDIKERTAQFIEKDIEEYSNDELHAALSYIENNRDRFEGNTLGATSEEILENLTSTSSISDIDNIQEANIFQGYLIDKIIGSKGRFGNGYIRGYNEKRGNYVESVNNFETKVNGADPRNINSKELGSYFLMIESQGELTESKLKGTFGKRFLVELGKIWRQNDKDGNMTMLQEMVKRSSLISLIEATKVRQGDITSIQDTIEKNKDIFNHKEKEFFRENISSIKLITEESKLKEVLDYFNTFEESKKGVSLQYINESLIEKVISYPNIRIGFDGINSIPESMIENKIGTIIIKLRQEGGDNPFTIDRLLDRAIKLGFKPEIVLNIIEDYSITISETSTYLNWYIGEHRQLNENEIKDFNTLREKYNNFKDLTEEQSREISSNKEKQKIISTYIIENSDQLNIVGSEMSNLYINLIESSIYGTNTNLLFIPHTNVEISKAFMDKSLVVFIPKEHLESEELLDYFLSKINTENIEEKISLLGLFDYSNINRVLQVYSYLQKLQRLNDPNMPEIIKIKRLIADKMKDENIKYIIVNSLIDSQNKGIEVKKEHIEDYYFLIDDLFINDKIFGDNFKSTTEEYNKETSKLNEAEKNTINNNVTIKIGNVLNDKLSEIDIKGGKEEFINRIKEQFGKGQVDVNDLEYTIRSILELEGIDKTKSKQILGEITESILEIMIEENSRVLNVCLVETQKSFEAKKEEEKLEIVKYGNGVINEDGTINKELIEKKLIELKEGKSQKEFKKELSLYMDEFNKLKEIDTKTHLNLVTVINAISNDFDFKRIKEHKEIYVSYVQRKINNENNDPDVPVEEIDLYDLINKEVEKKENQKKKEQEEAEIQQEQELTNHVKQDTIFDEYTFDSEVGKIYFESENGNKVEVQLTEKEKTQAEKDSKFLEKVVKFHKILDDVGLSSLGRFKEDIFKAISNVAGITFSKVDGDYLNDIETKKFLNYILKSIGEDEINDSFSIENFKAEFERKNNTQFGGSEAENMKYGTEYTTKIAAKFLKTYTESADSSYGFDIPKFEKAIK